MKVGWEIKTLGEVCEVFNGGTPKTGVAEYWDGEHQWITPAEMGKRSTPYISETARTVTSLGLKNSSARPLPPYSVILSSRAPIGHLVVNTEPMATNQGCKGLVPTDSINYKFLFFYLSSIVDLLNDLGSGATFKELSGGKLKEVKIPLPPLPEQKRLVTLLDEAFESIATAKANAQQNLKNALALFESHLNEVFTKRGEGWEVKTLGDLATFRNGINFTKSSKGDSIKIVGVKDFQNNFFAPVDDLNTVTIDNKLPDSDVLKENDILFVRSNGNLQLIGRCMLVGAITEKMTHSGFAIRARLNDESLLPKYICHFLKSNTARQKMIDGGNGTNIKSLNQTTLSDMVIPIPTISEQAQIVYRIEILSEETQRLEALYSRKIAALDELKKALLHRAFSGEL